MQELNCPACGAPLKYQTAVALFYACEYCRTQSMRTDKGFLEALGRVAELLEDASPIQIGTEGRADGEHFTCVGRIQLRYEAGLWNEWHLMFDDGKSGWLSEAQGFYCVTRQVHVENDFSWDKLALRIGTRVALDGVDYTITNAEKARCVSGEGSLPFRVRDGFDVNSVDLRTPNAGFATLDFSEQPALVYLGKSYSFGDLQFSNLVEFENWAAPLAVPSSSGSRGNQRRGQ